MKIQFSVAWTTSNTMIYSATVFSLQHNTSSSKSYIPWISASMRCVLAEKDSDEGPQDARYLWK